MRQHGGKPSFISETLSWQGLGESRAGRRRSVRNLREGAGTQRAAATAAPASADAIVRLRQSTTLVIAVLRDGDFRDKGHEYFQRIQ